MEGGDPTCPPKSHCGRRKRRGERDERDERGREREGEVEKE